MKCIYKFNGKIFNSELELDEEILRLKCIKDDIHDLVFSKTYSEISEKYNQIIVDALSNYDELQKSNKTLSKYHAADLKLLFEAVNAGNSPLDIIRVSNKRGYASVTEMLHGAVTLAGKPLQPNFVFDNWWNEVKGYLKRIKTDNLVGKKINDKVLFDEDFCINLFGSLDLVHDIPENELDYYKNKISEQLTIEQVDNGVTAHGIWPSQAIIGSLTHEVFKIVLENDLSIPKDKLRELLINKTPKKIQDSLKVAQNKNNGKPVFNNEVEGITSMIDSALEIREYIKTKFKNPRIYTEIKVVGDAQLAFNPLKVLGIIDLVVIDDDGNVEIFDYKCSPKSYSKFDTAKKRTFYHLLSVYRRLIENLGIHSEKRIAINVIPVKFKNFHYNDDSNTHTATSIVKNGYVTFDGVELEVSSGRNIIRNLDNEMTDPDTINSNVDYIVPAKPNLIDDDNIIESVNNFMRTCFPEYTDFKSSDDTILERRIKEVIDNNGGFQTDPNNGKPYVYFKKNNRKVSADSEIAIIDTLKKEWKEAKSLSKVKASNIKTLLLKALSGEELFSYRAKGILRDELYGTLLWSEQILKKYANSNWQVIKSKKEEVQNVLDILEAHGIILILNLLSKVIDVVKCSADNLWLLNFLGPKSNRRKYILGTFLSDDISTNNLDNLVLEAVNGNLELMETMAVLNAAAGTLSKYGATIGDVTVVNTSGKNGIGGLSASNELLLYNFRRLCNLGKFENKFGSPNDSNFKNSIKMCSFVQQVLNQLLDLKIRIENGDKGVLQFKDLPEYSVLDTKNKELLRLNLLDLKEKLEEIFPYLTKRISGGASIFDYNNSPEYKLYIDILLSIAEVDGVKIVQLISNHPKFFENISSILQQGLNGSYTDNPGTLQSLNLNKLAYLTERGYLNVRASVTKFNEEFLKKLRKYKEYKSFNWIEKVTIGNLASIYQNLYDPVYKERGELLFKSLDDPSLTNEEKEFLTYCVLKLAYDRIKVGSRTINKNGVFLEEAFWDAYEEDPDLILQVPLIRASFASTIASSGGLIKGLKAVFSQLLPSNIKEFLTSRVYEFLDVKSGENSLKNRAKSGDLYEMINRIDNSYDFELRQKLLHPVGKENQINLFETNLETILLSSKMARDLKTELDKIFPSLKAITASLALQGTVLNTQFVDDLLYASDYIKNKIHGLPLEDLEKFGMGRALATGAMSAASKMALAFNPLQLYLVLDGLWKDIMLMKQRPDIDLPDETAFTKKNMIDSFMWITSDIKHLGDKPTLGEALNRLYGINDMDINKFHQAISTDNAGVYNFWSLGFRFTSRPDYYNRMTIFGAQMRKDGCFEAHSVSEDGELIYDWTKDKRFDRYAKGDKSDIQLYNKLKALYLAMANEFMQEGAKNSDGSLFIINNDSKPTPLPRAYTTKQSESMKALGDKIYGYYSHEKRSMILSYTLGAMFMLMHTYWSSKKNLYLTGHSFTLQGDYEQYEEVQMIDGKELKVKYWLVLNEQGDLEIVSDNEVGDRDKIPYMVWKGRPQEGIVVTLMNILHDLIEGDRDEVGNVMMDENGNPMRGWSYMFDKHFGEHVDEKLRTLYHANITLLAYDLFMLLLLGGFVAPALSEAADKHIKATGNKTFNNALNNSCIYGLTKMFLTSTDDFNMIKSIGGQVTDWNPFSLSMLARSVTAFKDLFVSDKDSYDILVNIPTATRNLRPMFDYAKYQATGRFIGLKAED